MQRATENGTRLDAVIPSAQARFEGCTASSDTPKAATDKENWR
jgi:hypothetical protein